MHAVEYSSVVKRNELVPAETWVDLRCIMRSEEKKSPNQKTTYCVVSGKTITEGR